MIARNIHLENFYLRMVMARVVPPNALPKTSLDDFDAYIGSFEETDRGSPFLIKQALVERPFLEFSETNITLKSIVKDQDIFIEKDVY